MSLAPRLLLGALPVLSAQTPPPALPSDLTAFFSGAWTGMGAFASGKPIEADVTFAPELGGRWLAYRHRDRPPGRYEALGLWGADPATGGLLMTLHDNGGGFRRFEAGGWKEGRLVFTCGVRERFTFERQGDGFRMTYEVSRDGQAWRLVDALTFQRKP